LILGVPPILAGMKNALIQDAPGMAGTELLAIWICFSLIFYCLLGGLLVQAARGSARCRASNQSWQKSVASYRKIDRGSGEVVRGIFARRHRTGIGWCLLDYSMLIASTALILLGLHLPLATGEASSFESKLDR
jgi:hypothetical protein